MRLLRIKGELRNKEGEPSRFNAEKYRFFLEAPFEISDYCCKAIKKAPAHDYFKNTGKVPFIATTCEESFLRVQKWLAQGCNAFEANYPSSKPLSFWTEQDILRYIKMKNLPIASIYGEVVVDYEKEGSCTGQISFSDLGLIEDNRPLKTTGVSRTGCMFCGFGCHLEKAGEGRFERMKITHPKQYDYIMRPKEKGGLDYKNVIDWINENGNLHIRY